MSPLDSQADICAYIGDYIKQIVLSIWEAGLKRSIAFGRNPTMYPTDLNGVMQPDYMQDLSFCLIRL